MKNHLHKRRGFTLVELAIVMGVIGAIMGAIWYAASNAREAQKDGDAVNELQTTVQNLVTLMAGHSFSGAALANVTPGMITAQVIPSTYVNVGGTTANTPWGAGNFIIYAPVTVAAPGNRRARLSFLQVTKQGCIALLTQATACQTGQSSCPVDVQTDSNGTGNNVSANASTGWATVMTSTLVNTMCNANSYTGGTNSVDLDYAM